MLTLMLALALASLVKTRLKELKKKLLPRVSVVRSSTQSQIEIFALLFATFQKKNVFKCVLHVQHDFSLFNQSRPQSHKSMI